MFSSLLGMLDKSSLASMAGALGEPEQSVSHGMESSIAAVLGGLAGKSGDPSSLRRILDLVPETLGEVSGPQMVSSVANADSPLQSVGRRLMSGLFGNSESAVTSALSTHSGVRPGAMSTLMAMAAPMVMSFIGRRVREERMTMGGLGSLLQRESATFRSALPASLCDLFWPRASAASTVVAQAVVREQSSTNWLPLLAVAALIPALFWIFNHGRRPALPPIAPATTGTANRIATEATTRPKLPDNVDLQFDSGSAKLRPESQARLDDFAAILIAIPNARMKCTGNTDSVGNPEQNLRLSQRRAEAVRAELVRQGISPDRIVTEGSGPQNPVADNSTSEGRAQNRHVMVFVTQ
jgi:outer membrane protein OmpA-like peptidoglycan-associated protein